MNQTDQVGKLSEEVTFAAEYRVIVLGHTSNFNLFHAKILRKIIYRVLTRRNVKEYFYGLCFGKYDFAVEFTSVSAKTASDIACTLGEKINKRLEKTHVRTCISLVFGVEVFARRTETASDDFSPVRAYVFVHPSTGELWPMASAIELMSKKKPTHTRMKFLWAQGIHKVLVISGPCYEGVVEKLDRFRNKMKDKYRETSTCLALDFRGKFQDGNDSVDERHRHRLKSAAIYTKQKSPGALLLPRRSGIVRFPGQTTEQLARLGGFDTLLLVRRKNLKDILNLLHFIRKKNSEKIVNTSTVLLYRGEKQ